MIPLRLAFMLAVLTGSLPVASAPLKVACVGDSITEGAGLGNRTYPAKLGQLLGSGYDVRNFGVGGRTLLKQGDYPYWNESAYQASRSWEPDVVVIKLGTNDSKPQNWLHSADYVMDYEALIASYTGLSSQPRIVLATPCPVYGSGAFDISPTIVAEEIAPMVRELATRLGCELIDYHERMAGHDNWFPDNVHPNASGTTVMAALAYQVLMESGQEPSPPSLTIRSDGGGWRYLEWPLEGAGFVLEERYAFDSPRARWVVTQSVAVNAGTTIRFDSLLSGKQYFYRLWRP